MVFSYVGQNIDNILRCSDSFMSLYIEAIQTDLCCHFDGTSPVVRCDNIIYISILPCQVLKHLQGKWSYRAHQTTMVE